MKTLLGIVPLVLAIPSYIDYLYGVYKGKTTPLMYSWLIWAILAGISYAAQVSTGAGPGAWNTGFTAFACFAVFIAAMKYGDRRLSKIDSALLVVAFFAIIARLLVGNYTIAILLTTVAALIGFTLTIKKAYRHPHHENPVTFSINSLRSLISLFALSSISFVTLFYPLCMTLANFAVVAVIVAQTRNRASKDFKPYSRI